MRRGSRIVLLLLAAGVLICVAIGVRTIRRGFSARDEPSGMERRVARQARRFAMPAAAREWKNPVPGTPEVLVMARAHFADHCALCHGNDGRGKTEIGRNLYPKAPDMTLAETQSLSDGELFSVIKNGIRLTGMPAWGGDNPVDDRASWELVHLIRHFPTMTPGEMREMESLNPVSPAEMRETMEEQQFLAGGDEPPAPTPQKHGH